MADMIRVQVKGMREIQQKTERIVRDLRGGPFLMAMRNATLIVDRAAKMNAPVDTGRLRASITPEIRTIGEVVYGVVGSNVSYAPRMEKPGNVRRSGRRPYLQPALEENQGKIVKMLDGAVGRIVS